MRRPSTLRPGLALVVFIFLVLAPCLARGTAGAQTDFTSQRNWADNSSGYPTPFNTSAGVAEPQLGIAQFVQPDPKTLCQVGLFVANADGSGQQQLSRHPSRVYDPRWSPDGNSLLFSMSETGETSPEDFGLYTYGLKIGIREKVATGFIRSADWISGTSLVYNDEATSSIVRVDTIDSMPVTTTLKTNVRVGRLDYHPTSGIVYDDMATGQMYRMNLDGSGLVQLTRDEGVHEPRWSPDGSRIAFISGASSATTSVQIVNADGTGRRQLTEWADTKYAPTWTSNGSQILFTEATWRGPLQLRLLTLDNDAGFKTSAHLAFGDYAEYSPDGKQLVFTDYVCPRAPSSYHTGISGYQGTETRGYAVGNLLELTTVVSSSVDLLKYEVREDSNADFLDWSPAAPAPSWSGSPLATGLYTATLQVRDPDQKTNCIYLTMQPTGMNLRPGCFPFIRSTYWVAGKVTYADGTPVSNAGVYLEGRDGFWRMVVTNAAGEYKIRWLPRGDYWIRAFASGQDFGPSRQMTVDDYAPDWTDIEGYNFVASGNPPAAEEPAVIGFGPELVMAKENGGTYRISLNRTGGLTSAFTATLNLGGLATYGADYTVVGLQPGNNPVVFRPGETAKHFDFALLDDSEGEGPEGITLLLQNGTGYSLQGRGRLTLEIEDDDPRLAVSVSASKPGAKPGEVVSFTTTITNNEFTPQGGELVMEFDPKVWNAGEATDSLVVDGKLVVRFNVTYLQPGKSTTLRWEMVVNDGAKPQVLNLAAPKFVVGAGPFNAKVATGNSLRFEVQPADGRWRVVLPQVLR